jgi:hypothetical protein
LKEHLALATAVAAKAQIPPVRPEEVASTLVLVVSAATEAVGATASHLTAPFAVDVKTTFNTTAPSAATASVFPSPTVRVEVAAPSKAMVAVDQAAVDCLAAAIVKVDVAVVVTEVVVEPIEMVTVVGAVPAVSKTVHLALATETVALVHVQVVAVAVKPLATTPFDGEAPAAVEARPVPKVTVTTTSRSMVVAGVFARSTVRVEVPPVAIVVEERLKVGV